MVRTDGPVEVLSKTIHKGGAPPTLSGNESGQPFLCRTCHRTCPAGRAASADARAEATPPLTASHTEQAIPPLRQGTESKQTDIFPARTRAALPCTPIPEKKVRHVEAA